MSMEGTASMAPLGYAVDFPKLTCTDGASRGGATTSDRQAGDSRATRPISSSACARRCPFPRAICMWCSDDWIGRQSDDPAIYGPVSDGGRSGSMPERWCRCRRSWNPTSTTALSRPRRLSRLVERGPVPAASRQGQARLWRIRRSGGCSASTATTSRRRWARSPACASPQSQPAVILLHLRLHQGKRRRLNARRGGLYFMQRFALASIAQPRREAGAYQPGHWP